MGTPFVPSSSNAGYNSLYPSSSTWITTPILTTVYTPPATCADRPFTAWYTDKSTLFATRSAVADAQCYPPGWYAFLKHTNEVYSPGVCPTGWPSAAQDVHSGVTTAACCPKGMTYLNTDYCGKYVSTSTTVAIYGGAYSTVTTPFVALDYHVLVAWASSDLNSFTPTSAPLLANSNATTSTALPHLHVKTTHSPHASHSHRVVYQYEYKELKTGGIVGIVFGSIIGAMALVAMVAFWTLWRRERAKRIAAYTAMKQMVPIEAGEIRSGKDGFPEIDGVPLVELDKSSIHRPESAQLTEIPGSIATESLASRSHSIDDDHER